MPSPSSSGGMTPSSGPGPLVPHPASTTQSAFCGQLPMILPAPITIAHERRRNDLHERHISKLVQQVACHGEMRSSLGLRRRGCAAWLGLVLCASVAPSQVLAEETKAEHEKADDKKADEGA